MKVCVSLGNISTERCAEVMRTEEFVELRLDLLSVIDELPRLLSIHAKAVVTYRPKVSVSDAERQAALIAAIHAGATFVDVELEASPAYLAPILEAATIRDCLVIISYHNFEYTPEDKELKYILDRCLAVGHFAKIACQVCDYNDNYRLLNLLRSQDYVVVVGMGQLGKLTRVLAPLYGAPFTYAALDHRSITAPGQLPAEDLKLFYQQCIKLGLAVK